MKKGSFILYDADLEGLEYISDLQAGKLFKAIRSFRLGGDSTFVSKNPAVNILYSQITGHISINEEKYNTACKKKSQAMKKRWSEDNKTKEEDSTLYSSLEKGCLLGDNDNDNENENENVNVNVNVNVNENDNDNDNKNDIVTDNVPCGAKTENKRKNCYSKNVPRLLQDEPSYDIEAFKRKSLERYRNALNQP